jgi:hypothetical protein
MAAGTRTSAYLELHPVDRGEEGVGFHVTLAAWAARQPIGWRLGQQILGAVSGVLVQPCWKHHLILEDAGEELVFLVAVERGLQGSTSQQQPQVGVSLPHQHCLEKPAVAAQTGNADEAAQMG